MLQPSAEETISGSRANRSKGMTNMAKNVVSILAKLFGLEIYVEVLSGFMQGIVVQNIGPLTWTISVCGKDMLITSRTE